MYRKKLIQSLSFAVCVLSALSGCAGEQQGAIQRPPAPAPQSYSADSWKEMIAAECRSFFDGCNNCRRNPDNNIAACTRKACFAYAKPYCTDAQRLIYQCAEGKSFTLSLGEYRADDQRLALKEGQVMYSDNQTRLTSLLDRQPSASGTQYSDGKVTVATKGVEALVQQGDRHLYTNCRIQD